MGNRVSDNNAMNRVMHLKQYAAVVLCTAALVLLTACSLITYAPITSSPTPTIAAEDSNAVSSVPVTSIQPQDTPGSEASVTDNIAPVTSDDTEPAAPLFILNQEYAAFGRMTIAGMKGSDYDKAMAIEWTDIETNGSPVPYDIDLANLMDYHAIEQYILNLGKYDGVNVSVIGKSEMDRNIYMLSINLSGETDENKPLIMLTGSVHAREFAGVEYMLKFLNDTLIEAQTDAYTRSLLESVTIVAIPLVNPDGREMIISGGDPNRKSNKHGVDLNRAMPSVNAGQLIAGGELPENFSYTPGLDFFAGYRLGSESETQAMIKWFNTYVPKAAVYIDLHQQGGVSFYNKPFTSSQSDEACLEFAEKMDILLGGGYEPKAEKEGYSLNGDGGTLTDYARSVSEGFVYSYRLGRMALLIDSVETPLICFGDIDNCPQYYDPLNPDFVCMTLEIGRKPTSLGPESDAREQRAAEYEEYGWDHFLTGTIENILGE